MLLWVWESKLKSVGVQKAPNSQNSTPSIDNILLYRGTKLNSFLEITLQNHENIFKKLMGQAIAQSFQQIQGPRGRLLSKEVTATILMRRKGNLSTNIFSQSNLRSWLRETKTNPTLYMIIKKQYTSKVKIFQTILE